MIKDEIVQYFIDKEILKEAEKVIRKLGVNPPTAISLLYIKIMESKKIPFETTPCHKNKKVRRRFRMKKSLKEGAEKIIKSSGLTPTSVFNMFYNEIIQRQALPFEVKLKINDKETNK